MAITKTYLLEIDGKKAEASVGQLKAEVQRLEEVLDNTTLGSLEADALIAELGRAKAALKDLDEAVDVTFDKDRAGAYVDAVNGIAGAYGIALVAAQNFGLSEKDVEKYQQRMQEVLTVVASLEQLQRLTTSEVRASLKLLGADTVNYIKTLFAQGEAYIFTGTAATGAGRAARLALIATGLGAFIVLVGTLVANWDKVKEVTSGWAAKFKPELEALSGFVDDVIAKARNVASFLTGGLIDDAATAAKVALVKHQKDLDALQLEADARRIKEMEAAGKDTYELRRVLAIRELNALKRDTEEEKKAYLDKESEITVMINTEMKRRADEAEKARKEQEQKDKAAADKARAEREKKIQEEYQAFLKRNQALEKLQIIDYAERLRRDIEAENKRQEAIAKAGQLAASAAGRITAEVAAQQAERARIAAIPPLSFTDNLLVRLFGVHPDQLEATKAEINNAAQQVSSLVSALFAIEQQEADAALSSAQERLGSVTQALSDAQSAAEATAQQLATADGARRDYLTQKLEKQRAAEDKLRAEKAKALKEEQQAQRVRTQLDKEAQQASLASALASTVATGAKSVEAAVNVIAGASKLTFPANIAAVVAGLAVVTSAILQAKQLGKSFEQGGLIDGPRHAQGGIQMWHRNGAHLGEMEGGEFIFSRKAVSHYGVPALERMNDAASTRVLAPPMGLYVDGGAVGAGALPPGAVVVQSADLAELVATNKAMLARLTSVADSNQQIADYGPARLGIGPAEALAIEEEKQKAMQTVAQVTL
jgi:hypothetical protein